MSSKQVAKRVEAIKDELSKPIPEHLVNKENATVATKTSTKKKSAAKKTAAAKKAPAEKSGDDNLVSLADLAKEAKISGQQARQKLRAAGVERPDGKRWGWAPKSKALGAARKALGL